MRSRVLNVLQKKRIYMFANGLVSQIFTRSNLQTFHNGIILFFFFSTQRRIVDKLSNTLIAQSNIGTPNILSLVSAHFAWILRKSPKTRYWF